jgi:dipicolinate synthase subunit A
MLTGRHFVFIGGDLRQLEVIRQVVDNDASVHLIGFDKCRESFVDTSHAQLKEDVLHQADAIVLPVAGMDDDGMVTSRFSTAPIRLEEHHFSQMRTGTKIFTGIAGSKLSSWAEKFHLDLIRLMERDDVAILNSIPTAEGAIALAMEKTSVTIHGSLVTLLGFGRCGRTLARTLHALGAKVEVCARHPDDLARIREMGMVARPMRDLVESVRRADIVFNTIPSMVLPASVLKEMRVDCVIIDIASKPGGTDFRYAERRGMTAILTPSLPGMVAPKTAGQIIAASVCELMNADDLVEN